MELKNSENLKKETNQMRGKNRKRNRIWILFGIAVLLVIVAGAAALTGGMPVETAMVKKGEVVKLIKESGTVESKSTVVIAAKNSGEVKGLNVTEGDHVKAGDLLMTSDGTSALLDIKSQQAELSGLQAQYGQAKELADKNKTLYEQGALSYEVYQTSNTAAKQLAAQVAALQYAIKSYAESSGAAGIAAPIDGYITEIYVSEGETVSPGTSLLEISNLNDTYVKVELIAEDADLVRNGDPVRIYNEDANFSDDKGSVRKVYLKAQEKMSDLGVNQKRVTIEVAFGGTEVPRLGSNVDVEIAVEKKDGVIRVPDISLFEMDKKDYVYVVSGRKAQLREVKKGLEGEDFIEIRSGLKEGEAVILSPGDDLSDGAKVKVVVP